MILLAACNTNGVRTIHNRTTVPIVFSSIQDRAYVPACATMRFRWGPYDGTEPNGGRYGYVPLDALPPLAADQLPVLVDLPMGGPDSNMDYEAVVTRGGARMSYPGDKASSLACEGVAPAPDPSPSSAR